jgi:hypothetical protein
VLSASDMVNPASLGATQQGLVSGITG